MKMTEEMQQLERYNNIKGQISKYKKLLKR